MVTFAGHIGQRHQRSSVACFHGLPPFWRANTKGDRVRPLWWKGYRPRVRPRWKPKGAKRHTGEAANTSQVPHSRVDRPKRWAQWIFSMNSLWQEDSLMPDRPLTVHCSGLGGGLLSPDHEYDLFFQNHAQMKVYGPSLAMTDDWEQHITNSG